MVGYICLHISLKNKYLCYNNIDMFPIVYCTNIDVTNITIYEYITEHKKIQYYYDKIYTNLQHIITLIAKYKMSNNKLILSGIFVPLILNDTNTLYHLLLLT